MRTEGSVTATPRSEAVMGSLLGTAVADAMGLPWEGLSYRRQQRLAPQLEGYRFLAGRGMVSDDTEHACLVASSLIASGAEPERFSRELAVRLRWWLLALPAGVGLATARAVVKLWLGFSPVRSGVFSAGNGPAMRSPIIGASCGSDRRRLVALVQVSTRMTHTDPRAEQGALAVALAAAMAAEGHPPSADSFLPELEKLLEGKTGTGLKDLLAGTAKSVAAKETSRDYARRLGLADGVTGYIFHTVPVALHICWSHPRDFHAAVHVAVRLGGDTDTVAAIVGGIVGASVGRPGIPEAWLGQLWEWPRTVDWMERTARRLAEASDAGQAGVPVPLAIYLIPFRNALFLVAVLTHGFRRLLPPY